MTGKVKFFDQEKGFGFIISDDNQELFVHHTGCVDKIKQDDEVTFEEESGPRGPKAIEVQLKS